MSETARKQTHEKIHQVVDQYQGELLRYANYLLRHLETARDVVQDTFVKLCSHPQLLAPSENSRLRPWLFTVCRNRALDVLKKRNKVTTMTAQQANQQPAPGPTQVEQSERTDSAAHVMELVDQLSDNQKEVVRLKFQNGLSYKEIAGITKLSVSNVGYLIHTAVQKLRQQLRVDFS